ncbi:MAG TPA: hypothetical protein PKZ53_01930 [Acidobacteriota bacterium]|nr:hypothetical protein [Acidobacteriota bacterium]
MTLNDGKIGEDKETRGQGDEGYGDKETRGQGDKENEALTGCTGLLPASADWYDSEANEQVKNNPEIKNNETRKRRRIEFISFKVSCQSFVVKNQPGE